MSEDIRFRVRVYLDDVVAIGPGKVELLEAIKATGSISGAARRLGMSYRRAWLLIEEMNKALVEPAVTTATGGQHGGGAALTRAGETIVRHYRAMEAKARSAAEDDLAALKKLLAR